MPLFVLGQTNYTLKGTVSNQGNERLAGASIFLSPIEVGTSSSNQGIYLLENLPEGKYEIKVSFIGYDTFIDTLEITSDRIFDIKLMEAPVNLQEVFVNANYSEALKRKESLNIEVINDDYLKANLTGSLMKSLENLPGITTIDIGSGQSKPVIRGLGFNRVVVVENSIKHEAQQWGADHGLEIDQYAVNNIEVIKGPASLMYGSDAIGGVINMKSTMLPRDNSFGGVVDLTGNTNNYLMGGSIMLYGRKNWFFANIRATLIDYGDYKVPTDSVDIYSYRAALFENNVRNTAGNEKNFHVSAGIIKDNFFSKFYLSSVNTKSGFFANAHGLEPRNVDEALYDKSSRDINYPFQTVNHLKVINKSEYKFEKVLIEFDLGFHGILDRSSVNM